MSFGSRLGLPWAGQGTQHAEIQNDSASNPFRIPGPRDMGRRGDGQVELLNVIVELVIFVDLLYTETSLAICGRRF